MLGAQDDVREAVVVGKALVGGVVDADDVEGGHRPILPLGAASTRQRRDRGGPTSAGVQNQFSRPDPQNDAVIVPLSLTAKSSRLPQSPKTPYAPGKESSSRS
ncbi:hypothetical protein GCM10027063_24850 [Promicromonospora xylanilytica]